MKLGARVKNIHGLHVSDPNDGWFIELQPRPVLSSYRRQQKTIDKLPLWRERELRLRLAPIGEQLIRVTDAAKMTDFERWFAALPHGTEAVLDAKHTEKAEITTGVMFAGRLVSSEEEYMHLNGRYSWDNPYRISRFSRRVPTLQLEGLVSFPDYDDQLVEMIGKNVLLGATPHHTIKAPAVNTVVLQQQ